MKTRRSEIGEHLRIIGAIGRKDIDVHTLDRQAAAGIGNGAGDRAADAQAEVDA
jgi:hypothetical protein